MGTERRREPWAWRVGARGIVAPAGRLLFAPRVRGRGNVPATGGAVLAFLHVSYLDVLLVTQLGPRQVRFMGAAGLFRIPVLGRALRAGGVFGVRRGTVDRSALDTAVALCRGGELVGVFPEGGLQGHGGGVAPLRGGAARIALEAGVPLVPVAIGGHRLPRLRRAWVQVGEPLAPEGDAASLTDLLAARLRELAAPDGSATPRYSRYR